jgi:type IV pilus biogenesis protein PilP
MERSLLGGRTRTELAAFRPRARPESAQETAASEGTAEPSPLAVAVSRAPSRRPADFAAIVAATQQARRNAEKAPDAQSAPAVKASAATVAPTKPSIPSSASVAKQATIENAINLRKINLIGVYGSASDRRALVRLPSGRFVKVKVGDRIDGGQVAAIGDNELRYIKSGRNVTLTVPSG